MEDRYLFKAKRVYNGGKWVHGYYVKGLDMYDKEVHLIFKPNTMFLYVQFLVKNIISTGLNMILNMKLSETSLTIKSY